MAKDVKKKPAAASAKKEPAPPADPQARARSIRSTLKAILLLAFIAASVIGYLRARDHVAKKVAFRPDPPKIVLTEQPAWMSDARAKRIRAVAAPDVAHSAFDHEFLVNIAALLRNHPDTAPWIKEVRSVRRVYDQAAGDTVEIDCEYRAPVALVRWELYYWLIDAEGTLLPEQYTAADVRRVMYDKSGLLNLRIIDGVGQAPPESGKKWPGDDLEAGLDLIKLLHGKPFADEIELVNVANVNFRLDRQKPQMVLLTKYNTQVWWGRPVYAKDFLVEASPQQKLDYMAQIVKQFGRVDAKHSWVDLRFDWVMYPSSEAPGAEANTQ
jgi:hypothetical protein